LTSLSGLSWATNQFSARLFLSHPMNKCEISTKYLLVVIENFHAGLQLRSCKTFHASCSLL